MPEDMDNHEKLKFATLAMVGLGVGELIGSFANGAVIDKLSHRNALIICVFQSVTAFAFLIAFI
jgi:predicted MFS family arabinose efflux permease